MSKAIKIFTFYLKANIHIGLALLCFLKITEYYLNIKLPNVFFMTVFFGTVATYGMLKFGNIFFKKKNYSLKNKLLLAIIVLSSVAFLITFLRLENFIKKQFLIVLAILLLYPYARKNWVLKLLFVCFCIAYITVYIPFVLAKANQMQTILVFIQRLLIVFALLVPFEIKDISSDCKTIVTMPMILGIKNTKKIAYICLILVVLLSFLEPRYQIQSTIIAIATAIFLFYARPNSNYYFTAFWVESIPVFWYLLFVSSQQ